MTLARWLSRSDDKIRGELWNSRLRPFWIVMITALLLFPLTVLMLADFTTAASIHRGWIMLGYLLFQTPKSPAMTLILNFLYDLSVLVLLVLIPTAITLVYSRCPHTARIVAERFALFGLPILLLWHTLLSLLLLPRTPPDLSTNAGSTFWEHIVGLSLAVQYLCWGVTLYMLPASFKKAIGKKKRT